MNRFVARAHYRLHFRVKKLLRVPRKLDVTYTFASKQHTLDDLLARSRTQGFLVIKDGKIVDERYFNGANDKSKFTSWSVAKSFTSTLVGLALADGKIKSIDEPVTNYLPELKGSGYEGVPNQRHPRDVVGREVQRGIRQKRVGRHDHVAQDDGRGNRRRSPTTQSRWAAPRPPGTKFVYRSVDTAVLGMLEKRVAGESLADMLSQRIWQPLGMESDATWLTDHPGAGALEAAYCCINARLRDYGRFGLLFLNQGKAGGQQIVPSWWVAQATTPQSLPVQWGHLFPEYPDYHGGYGYQWWLIEPGARHSYSAEGVFFQFVYVMPEYNTVITKASA